jgi:hypothetical protein
VVVFDEDLERLPEEEAVQADLDARRPLGQPFKFGRAKVTRIGSTDLADVTPFTPRNLV